METTQRVLELKDRVSNRLPNESNVGEIFIMEAIQTIDDRLNIRLGTIVLPIIFESILVDAVVKMIRRQYYEGIDTERIDTIQTTFIENILDEYDKEIQSYVKTGIGSSNRNVVKFI